MLKAIKLGQALEYFAAVFNSNGNKYRKNYDLALSYEGTGDRAKAINCYQECIRLNPNEDLYKNTGMLYFEMNDYVSAVNYLEKTFSDQEAGFILGLSYLALNAPIKAEHTLEQMGNKKSTYARMLADKIGEFKQGRGRCGSKLNFEGNGRDGNNGEQKRLYNVLELTEVSSKTDIKKAYIRMAKKWHPDRFYNDPKLLSGAEQKMKVINEAYYKLCNS